jgi:hypothetical protein
VDPAAEPEVQLQLGAVAQRLAGVVVDGRGLPVAGARITVEAETGALPGERRTAVSDRRGGFEVAGCPPGPLRVVVTHGEHLRTTVLGAQTGDDLRVALSPGGVVEGEVVAERGGSAPGARVVLVDATGERRSGAVDALGRFRIAGCAPGPATVTAEAPGLLPATAPVDLPEADFAGDVVLRDLRFALVEAGSIAGTVTDDKGLPVVGASVESGGVRLRTDESGRFRLSPVPVGRVEVIAKSAVGEASDTITVERGRAAKLDLRLR